MISKIQIPIFFFSAFMLLSCTKEGPSLQSIDHHNTQLLYQKAGITSVRKVYVDEDGERELYKLTLYKNGMTKDSMRKIEFGGVSYGEETITFYPSGQVKSFIKSEITEPVGYGFPQPGYKYEGRSYPINKSFIEEQRNENGNYIYVKTIYNDTHEFITKYTYKGNTKTATKIGPIGDIISNITYTLDSYGNEISAFDNLANREVELEFQVLEGEFESDGYRYEVKAYFSERSIGGLCNAVITQHVNNLTTIISNCRCEERFEIADIRDGRVNLYINHIQKFVKDEYGNLIINAMRGANENEWSDFEKFEYVYNPDTTIYQKTGLDENDNVKYKIVFEYDQYGRVTKRKQIIIENNEIEVDEYVYNKDGLLEEKIESVNGEWTNTMRYYYD